jgi:hypothetical protein
VSSWLDFLLVPLAIVLEEEGEVGIGRMSDAEGGCPIVGRFSYDNIIVFSLLILWKCLLQSVWRVTVKTVKEGKHTSEVSEYK